MSAVKLYLKYIGMTAAGQLAYKTSFVMTALGHFVLTAIELLGIFALFARFDNISGWGVYEVAIFYGLINCAFAITEAVARGYDVFDQHIRLGTLDRLLLRPRSLNLQILGSEFQLMRVGRLLQGVLAIGIGMVNTSHVFTLHDGLLMLMSVVSGVMVFTGLLVIQSTICIWTVQSIEMMNAFTYGGVQMAQYPMDIYRNWFRRLFTFVIPVGAVNYLPMSAVLRDGSMTAAYMTPLLALAFLVITLQIFRFGIRYYCSTGS